MMFWKCSSVASSPLTTRPAPPLLRASGRRPADPEAPDDAPRSTRVLVRAALQRFLRGGTPLERGYAARFWSKSSLKLTQALPRGVGVRGQRSEVSPSPLPLLSTVSGRSEDTTSSAETSELRRTLPRTLSPYALSVRTERWREDVSSRRTVCWSNWKMPPPALRVMLEPPAVPGDTEPSKQRKPYLIDVCTHQRASQAGSVPHGAQLPVTEHTGPLPVLPVRTALSRGECGSERERGWRYGGRLNCGLSLNPSLGNISITSPLLEASESRPVSSVSSVSSVSPLPGRLSAVTEVLHGQCVETGCLEVIRWSSTDTTPGRQRGNVLQSRERLLNYTEGVLHPPTEPQRQGRSAASAGPSVRWRTDLDVRPLHTCSAGHTGEGLENTWMSGSSPRGGELETYHHVGVGMSPHTFRTHVKPSLLLMERCRRNVLC
ncbi:unnamed protein product [Arctogadus glacialis]